MRLNAEQVKAIKAVFCIELGEDTKVWLFGSRVNDAARGGDIDLYVETATSCSLEKKLCLIRKIQQVAGFRKVDLLIKTPVSEHKAIFDTAKSEGVLL